MALRTYGDPSSASSVLLIHDVGMSGACWHVVAKSLQDHGHFVVCPDLRGHGCTDWSTPNQKLYSNDLGYSPRASECRYRACSRVECRKTSSAC